MKNRLFDTDTVSLNDILSNGKIYKVPVYQRDYSWTESNWDDLWTDIVMLTEEDDPHYMGSVVFQTNDKYKFTIIDGQQRLATLSIIILAAIRNLQDLIDEDIEKEANKERKNLLMNTYLGAKDAVSLNYSSKLFLNENDDQFYQYNLLQFKAPNYPKKLSKSEKAMWDAYEYFRIKIKEHFSNSKDGGKLAAFITKQVAEKLMFIRIVVDDELNAYTVFETLNARGLELTTTDLLKNYLLSISAESAQDQKLAKDKWKKMTRITGLDDFPNFLRYYWNSRNKLVRKDKLFKTIRNSIKSSEAVFRLLDNLEKAAIIYDALKNPNDDFWEGRKEIRNKVRELNLFRVTQCYPLLITAYEKFDIRDFEKILNICSVISFRYNVISNLNPNSQEDVYNKASKKIFDGEIASVRSVAKELLKIYPNDEDFMNAFSTKSINTRRGKKLIRYILYSLESKISLKETDYEDDPGTIEHILPINPLEAWEESFDMEIEASFIYRLGNLTLLENSKNKDCLNKSYEEKKEVYKISKYKMTANIDYPEWTPSQIMSRQKKLAKLAKTVWRIDF